MKLIEELCECVSLTKKQLKKLRDAGFISERFFKFESHYSDYGRYDVDPADYYDEQGRGHHVIEGVGEVWVTDGETGNAVGIRIIMMIMMIKSVFVMR